MKINRQDLKLKSPVTGREFTADIQFPPLKDQRGIVIFLHGFKGFKEWGHFNLIADYFALKGYAFIKFNFSLNGTTPEDELNFTDLEAFSKNTLTTEIDETDFMIDMVNSNRNELNLASGIPIFLAGHSLGGAIAMLSGLGNENICAVAAWASVADTGYFLQVLGTENWKKNGVTSIHNTRTGQDMPLKYSIYENWEQNRKKLDIVSAIEGNSTPLLLVHGTDDQVVPYNMTKKLKSVGGNVSFVTIEDADHTFGGRHPWESDDLSAHTRSVLNHTIDFIAAQAC